MRGAPVRRRTCSDARTRAREVLSAWLSPRIQQTMTFTAPSANKEGFSHCPVTSDDRITKEEKDVKEGDHPQFGD